MFRSSNFSGIPPVVKNLIIINILMFVITALSATLFNIDLNRILGLFFFKSELFKPIQIISHMFMHGSLIHIFFNMFMLWMFGRILENVWGPKRFFIFYFVCGFGAALLHSVVNYFQFQAIAEQLTAQQIDTVINEGVQVLKSGKNYTNSLMANLNLFLNIPTVGASGAVYGILVGFGVLFPNTPLYFMFIPVPVKAKYMIIGMIVFELYLGIQNSGGDNIAHFAHLGGALFGYLLIRHWRKNSNHFY